MTKANFKLSAQSRKDHGKAVARRMRRLQGTLPGVIYGADKQAVSLQLNHNDLQTMLNNPAVYSHILDLEIDGKSEQVILKALQRHPFRNEILHIDFLRIKAGEKLSMKVPLKFLNAEEAPGLEAGGVMSHQMTEIFVECLPKDLPEFVEVDLGKMEMDEALHRSDIILPKGVTFVIPIDEEHNQPIASIHEAKEEPEEPIITEESEEGAEGAEGEATSDAEADDSKKAESDKEDSKDKE